MEKHCILKKALQQIVHSMRRAGNPRKRWEDGVREDAITLLCTLAWKAKAKDRESWRQCTEDRFGL
jgi:hypothetical protein